MPDFLGQKQLQGRLHFNVAFAVQRDEWHKSGTPSGQNLLGCTLIFCLEGGDLHRMGTLPEGKIEIWNCISQRT
jgi:hypothetical protein